MDFLAGMDRNGFHDNLNKYDNFLNFFCYFFLKISKMAS